MRIKALTPWWRSSFSGALHLSGALAGCFLSLCCPHGVHPEISIKNEAEFRFATALSARSASLAYNKDVNKRGLCHGAVRTECIRGRARRPEGKGTLPRRCPHGVHLQKQTNFVCIMRRELVDSFSGTAKSSCADYFPILFCCQSDLYHHDRQPRTGNRPVLLCEQHSHFLCIRPSH